MNKGAGEEGEPTTTLGLQLPSTSGGKEGAVLSWGMLGVTVSLSPHLPPAEGILALRLLQLLGSSLCILVEARVEIGGLRCYRVT